MISKRNSWVRKAMVVVFTIAGLSATALAQLNPQQGTDRQVRETKLPVAQYDIGHIVKRLAGVESQVAELKKQNAALAHQIAEMKLKASLPKGLTSLPGTSVPERLKKLEDTVRNHTHYMPNIGIVALNALPGMQDIAGKAGVGHVIEQWKGIKVHVSFGNGGDLGRTGLPVVP